MKWLSRFFLGVLFLFSGFVKAIDPLGSAYKFGDYFQAFGLDFMAGLSLPLGIFLAAFELVLGGVLLLGYQKRPVYMVLLVFMSFFTLLTFILALTNPVSDCGCFGDAIILTNWQTFFKNVVFMIFVIILYRSRKDATNILSTPTELFIIILFFAGSFALSRQMYRHLPILDFRPYAIGTHIPSAMEMPPDAPADQYETILMYENLETGKLESFTLENYPTDTLRYRFETSESKLISKGYEPPIHDFGILSPDGLDVTSATLEEEGYTLLMMSYDLEKFQMENEPLIRDLVNLDRISGDFKFLPLTSDAGAQLESFTARFDGILEMYAGDEIMIKTMVRSNPGFMLIKNGTIVAKWSWRDFPEIGQWNANWPDILHQYEQEQDPEMEMLIREGIMEPISMDLIQFDRSAQSVIAHSNNAPKGKLVWLVYILTILAILLALHLISRSDQ